MTKRLLSVAAVAAVYLLTLASLHPLDVLAGVLLGAGLVWALGGLLLRDAGPAAGGVARRALAFAPFAVVIVRDIVRGTWRVALVVLHVRPLVCPGIVAVPLGGRSRTGVTVSSLVATLSPGEFLVDVDWEREVMLLHVLDASDPDAVRAEHEGFYRRWQEPVFP